VVCKAVDMQAMQRGENIQVSKHEGY